MEYFLLFHFHKKFKNEKYYQVDFNESRKTDQQNNDNKIYDITQTQSKIGRYLKEINIEFLIEWDEDGYSYDYYLPLYNTVLEYDGPVHFYHFQTQFLEKFQFRYRMIDELYKRRIVYIPYFEWAKLDIDSFNHNYLRKIIFSKSDYKMSKCFIENYDLNSIDRKY